MTHSEVRERVGVPPEGRGGFERPTRRSESGQEAHQEVQESQQKVQVGSKCQPGCLGEVGSPTRRSGKGRKAHSEVRGGWEAHVEVREGS